MLLMVLDTAVQGVLSDIVGKAKVICEIGYKAKNCICKSMWAKKDRWANRLMPTYGYSHLHTV
jgi:hypothetical protein